MSGLTENTAMTPQAGKGDATPPPRSEHSSFLRYGSALAVIAILLGTGVYFMIGHDDLPPPRQVREFTVVNIVTPPPPPPPPPPEQKMIEQPKLTDHEFKTDEKPVDKPKDEPVKDSKDEKPPGPLSLDAKAVGPGDLFNLGSKPGGSPYGGGGGSGSQWGWYSAKVQDQVRNALSANRKTRFAKTRIEIRIWADSTGRVNRVQLVTSTGDAELDAAIRDEALNGLVLAEPPPRGMPMPINTRITENRSS